MPTSANQGTGTLAATAKLWWLFRYPNDGSKCNDLAK